MSDPDTAGGEPLATDTGNVAGSSLSAATWTTFSRLMGFARLATAGAVLGPTYFGNTYQATNLVPNLAYEFLTGSLFISLLVPPLVRHVDRRDTKEAERFAGGFLGVALAGFACVVVVTVAAGPLVLGLLTSGVADPAVAAAQRRVGWVLLAMFMPQVLFYGLAATGAAVMNAHGRFALAASAPAFESMGIIATMVATAVVFGTGADVRQVDTPQLLLLGLGTTGSVGLHAAVQWWGASRLGVRLVPRAGWRDPEVREVVRRAVPSLGYAGLNSLRVFAVLVVANRVSGGVVAFQLALAFFHLPVAVWARPVAVAMLPTLARCYYERASERFQTELVRGAALALLLIVPASVFYAVLSRPLARAVAFGEMATPAGILLVAASLAALAPGVLGEAGFVIATHASYARHDARSPFRAMVVRTAVALAGMVVAFTATEGTALLVTLGLAISAGNIVSAWQLARGLRSEDGGERLSPALLRAFAASAVMLVPAYLAGVELPAALGGRAAQLLGVILAGVLALATFLAVERAWHSPELSSLRLGFRHLRPRAER